MGFAQTVGGTRYTFPDLRILLARATPLRSGDVLAGLAAETAAERVAAQRALADLPLRHFLNEAVVPYEADEVTRLILDGHDTTAFAPIAHLTVGGFRDWLLAAEPAALAALRPGLTPEMAAGVSKIMRLQDLIAVAAQCRVTTAFRNTLGLPGRLSIRLQPNDPVDDPRGVAAAILDGLLLGAGDAVIGVNPATDNLETTLRVLELLDAVRDRYAIPTQSCVLAHVTTSLLAIERGAPVDLVFQSIGGTEAVNRSFGVSLSLLAEAHLAALSLRRGSVGSNCMYFETGQGSALSAEAHHGVDQQTVEARAYAVARAFDPLLVNTVVGFIGPEYLFDGKQITRAGLEDHFCGKLLGLPMGVDVCYTNHAEADQDDMDALLTLLGVAGVTYIMGVPGADDVMLAYQSTSFHDGLYVRAALGKRPAPEFEAWMARMGIEAASGAGVLPGGMAPALVGLG
ncbi:ethanolamine ammonia-lyase subunit EutB [Paeniroseomonas aquatica]|uniref:Ethanolamine ammonia-lyase large subunit n=1 Tax=Paeniroseomonas aquatica TaxID=373043 RepID=A0ABT8A925_9PROT|nr:ethanolamine ammonia-lyase subunit EutB [Paeniroseomonas aquatica]MDN3566304.1 ethanolamine ammonia-lyase subunit EutB [Paeniroseomonas aquatica]